MVDIEYLKTRYFYLDEPVKYKLKDNEINIYPIQLKDSEFFLSSIGICLLYTSPSPRDRG